jgi:hypothetical protein
VIILELQDLRISGFKDFLTPSSVSSNPQSSNPQILKSRDLTLSLLVLLIRADHPHHAAAPDDLALVANPPNRCSHLHKDRLMGTSGREDLRI